MAKKIKAYIHTIDSYPAYFNGQQICFLQSRANNVLRFSREEIMSDRRFSLRWRKKRGFSNSDAKYGYKLFYISKPPKQGE